MKGIVLAGGSGTRLNPITKAISKQLLPIYDKPMIYYPLSVLMLAGIRDILIITTPEAIDLYINLLGDGSRFGLNLSYKKQEKPNGIVQAFIIGEDFINGDPVCLILGDNLFYGQGFSKMLLEAKESKSNASIFGYQVKDPNRYGIIEFDTAGKCISVEEKPKIPKSNYAVTGLYFFDGDVSYYSKKISPSARNELEITSLLQIYIDYKIVNVEILGRGFAWLDTGTYQSLLDASQFVETIEKRQGYKIACLEEIAYNQGWITSYQLLVILEKEKNNPYSEYLFSIIKGSIYEK